ncbi:hypothetical protein KY325_04055, partial [Candidatus Woesearchaeota archaeon]|nr:hypothetical protein [Candidatus Woesearchaeota archaeon]
WKDIVGEARIPWSKVTDNDIEPESFDECIFSEISRGKTPIEIKVELSHYSELPPRIRQELGIIEKPVEPAEVPVKPIAADVGDARTIHRPREHGGTRAYPTVGEDPFAGKKKPLEVFKDPDFIEKVERYFKICQFVHAKEAPEELIKRLEEPLFAGMVSLVLRYRAGNRDIQKRIQEIAQKYPEAFAELISEFRDPLTKKIEELEEMLENANAVRAAHLEEIGNLQTDVKNFKAGKAYAITEGQRNVDAEKKVNEDLRIDLARIAKERARAKRGNKAAVVLFLIAAASAGGIYYLNDQNKKLGESNGDQAVQINRLSGQNTQANEKIDMLEQKIVEMKEAFGGGDGDVGEAVKYLVDYISEVRVALTGTPSGSITVPALTYEGKLELVKKVYNIIVDFNGRVAELSRNHANVRSELEQYRTETQAKLEGLSVQLTDAKKTLADTEASLRTANNLTEEQKKQIEQYTAAAEELQGKLEELQEEVKKIPGLEDRVQKLTDDNSKLQTARDEALQRQNSAEEAAKKASERAIEATDRLQEAIKAIDQAGKEYDAAVAKNNDLMQKLAEAETVSQAYSTVQQQYQILLRHVNARIIRLPESIGDRVTPETDRQFFRGSLGEMYGQFEGVRFYVMPGDDGTDRPFAEVRRLVDGKIQVSFESIAEAGLVQLDQGFKRAAEAQYEANRKQVFNAFSFMMYEHFVRNGNEEYKATFAELAQQIGAMIKNPNIDVKAMLKKSMENTFGSMEDDSIYHIGNPFKKTEEKK